MVPLSCQCQIYLFMAGLPEASTKCDGLSNKLWHSLKNLI
jgi:hypothetical protein